MAALQVGDNHAFPDVVQHRFENGRLLSQLFFDAFTGGQICHGRSATEKGSIGIADSGRVQEHIDNGPILADQFKLEVTDYALGDEMGELNAE